MRSSTSTPATPPATPWCTATAAAFRPAPPPAPSAPAAQPTAALKTYLNNQIYPGINGNNLNVTTSYVPGPGATSCNATACNGGGDQVTVTVQYPYLYNIPFIPSNLINMNGTSTMVISQ